MHKVSGIQVNQEQRHAANAISGNSCNRYAFADMIHQLGSLRLAWRGDMGAKQSNRAVDKAQRHLDRGERVETAALVTIGSVNYGREAAKAVAIGVAVAVATAGAATFVRMRRPRRAYLVLTNQRLIFLDGEVFYRPGKLLFTVPREAVHVLSAGKQGIGFLRVELAIAGQAQGLRVNFPVKYRDTGYGIVDSLGAAGRPRGAPPNGEGYRPQPDQQGYRRPQPDRQPQRPGQDWDDRRQRDPRDNRQSQPPWDSRQPQPSWDSRQPQQAWDNRRPQEQWNGQQPQQYPGNRQPQLAWDDGPPQQAWDNRQPQAWDDRQPQQQWNGQQHRQYRDDRQARQARDDQRQARDDRRPPPDWDRRPRRGYGDQQPGGDWPAGLPLADGIRRGQLANRGGECFPGS
jgi:hypothetical protein